MSRNFGNIADEVLAELNSLPNDYTDVRRDEELIVLRALEEAYVMGSNSASRLIAQYAQNNVLESDEEPEA